MDRILPRFLESEQRVEDERRIAKAILEADEAPPDSNGRVLRRSADGHNSARRRGVPVISKGVGSTSPGTDPLGDLLAKEARGELGSRR